MTTDVCPKHMEYGPCAGVDTVGGCEVPGTGRCVFLDAPQRVWAGPTASRPDTVPRLVAHLAAPALDSDGLRRAGAVLAGAVDAVLSGDGPLARVQFPPSYRARLLLDEGVPAMAGLNCRDRNRVALEGELAALADLPGLIGVHAVTGDHTVRGHRPDALPVFDLDATRLTALAVGFGLLVTVAASPGSPPGPAPRAQRLAVKVAAGAAACLVDDTSTDDLALFASALTETGDAVPLLVGIPVLTSVAAVAAYPGAHLPPGVAATVAGSRDPRAEGLAQGESLARQALAVPGVRGVHLSPGVVPGRELDAMADVAELARRLAP